MIEELKRFFAEEGIEYAEVLSYVTARETAPQLLSRCGLSPRSMIVFLLPYYAGETENLSRYAAARDYHIAIRALTGRLTDRLSFLFPGSQSVGFGDHSPIDERHAAIAAGLGILGDSGLLINETYGTYVFIADVLTDIPPEALGAIEPMPLRRCEGCGACRRACPTGILRGEGESCLSAVTQKKGELSEEECRLMRRCHTAWGCDLCQTSCPHNRAPVLTPLSFFREERITALTEEVLASMDKESFSSRAFAWRGRRTVERNVAVLEGRYLPPKEDNTEETKKNEI